jgi:N-6 DNA Methylase
MTALDRICEHLVGLGYPSGALLRNYAFADVLSPSGDTRTIDMAAFTQTPPSYRTAAFGVIAHSLNDPAELSNYRALGAPAIFAVSGDIVELWQVRAQGTHRRLARHFLDDLPEFFGRNAEYWNPRAIHRAKSIASDHEPTQLDFVDAGLMIAIEGEIHLKLDALLRRTLSGVLDARGRPNIDARILFQATFRFLAAKILADRGHAVALQWPVDDIGSILARIDRYYGLGGPHLAAQGRTRTVLEAVWRGIRSGINFQNISADDLAFVYENTFVTSEVRADLGTHSTPRQMAEYLVRRLELWNASECVKVYEPFTGAGALLVAALRQLRANLPIEWSDAQRHAFLTERLSGDEIDKFAYEVAKLSLILADYPNHNGWDIRQTDLFEEGALRDRIDTTTFVVCNPPFEDFAPADRNTALAQYGVSKPVAVLLAVLDANPAGLGFVVPGAFILEKQYQRVRQRLEAEFGTIELVEIPDDVFQASRTAASLVIARDRRDADAPRRVRLRSSEVTLRDRLPFLNAGVITHSREQERWVPEEPTGELWIPPLQDLWAHLSDNPKLGDRLALHRGIEWSIDQAKAWRARPELGFRLGLHSAKGREQYGSQQPVYLDCRARSLRGGAINFDWETPKLLLNAARLSRYQWRIAASLDEAGLVASQQFIGAWTKSSATRRELLQLLAVLNGPVANAFATVSTSGNRFRIATLDRVPLPKTYDAQLASLVEVYLTSLAQRPPLGGNEKDLAALLVEVEAALLRSYDLPHRLERELLSYFDGARRPTAHSWFGWADIARSPGLSLSEILMGEGGRHSGSWASEVFRPLPEDEAAGLQAWIG